MYKTEAQMKITDIIRGELLEYIYSDDAIEDAGHIKTILCELDAIDLRFKDLEKENDDLRKHINLIRLKEKKDPTEGIKLFDE